MGDKIALFLTLAAVIGGFIAIDNSFDLGWQEDIKESIVDSAEYCEDFAVEMLEADSLSEKVNVVGVYCSKYGRMREFYDGDVYYDITWDELVALYPRIRNYVQLSDTVDFVEVDSGFTLYWQGVTDYKDMYETLNTLLPEAGYYRSYGDSYEEAMKQDSIDVTYTNADGYGYRIKMYVPDFEQSYNVNITFRLDSSTINSATSLEKLGGE